MICPAGNGADCHRNWEVLYMRRVPVMIRTAYMEELFKDFPVLFVNRFSDITEALLLDNDCLFDTAQDMDMNKLDLDHVFSACLAQSRLNT